MHDSIKRIDARARGEFELLSREFDVLSEDFDELNQTFSSLQDNYASLESDLSESALQIVELESIVEDATNEINQLEDKNSELRARHFGIIILSSRLFE